MRPEDDNDDDDTLDELTEAIDRLWEARRKWHDPAAGPLPEWVPAPIKTRYLSIWEDLLGRYSHEKVRALIKRYKRLGKEGINWEWIGVEPRKLHEDIGFLAHLEYALFLGKSEGLRELAGEDARRGRKVLDGSKESYEQLYGNAAEKELKYSEYQLSVDQLHKDHPQWGYRAIAQTAAEKFRVSERTIRSHTKNPKSRKA
jgi:hypothetical protein